jgi:hemerythrin
MLAEGRKWSQIVARSKRLRDKCFAHFLDEEAILERSKYKKLVAHAGDHRSIEKQLDDILASISRVARPSRAQVEALRYFRSMLVHHFFRYDIAYKAHLMRTRSKGSRSRPSKTR